MPEILHIQIWYTAKQNLSRKLFSFSVTAQSSEAIFDVMEIGLFHDQFWKSGQNNLSNK